MSANLVFIENKLNSFFNNSILSLFAIGIIALIIRVWLLPFNIPLTLDALGYFWYASDIIILGHLPSGYTFANNGWPTFLSIFFSLIRLENTIDYMNMQRFVTAFLSTLTIIPVYFLCKRFFEKPYALLGAAIFAFEPRIIQNSLLGITEPLYILLGITAFVLFLSKNKKLVYASFGVTALCAIVRSEALFLFLIISVLFFVRYRKESKVIAKYALAVVIFVAIVTPMIMYRIDTQGNDALFSRIPNEATHVLANENSKSGLLLYMIHGFENFFKFLGWSMIPIFIFFVPIGGALILKNRNQQSFMIILFLAVMSLPALYAYSIPSSDTRYLFFLYPMLCLLAIYPVKKLCNKFKNHNLVLILIISGILLSSAVFLDYKKSDYQHDNDAFSISKYVVKNAKGVNDYYPESSYLSAAQMPQTWPHLKSEILFNISVIPTDGFNSLENYIHSSKGLTHIVVDGGKNRPTFLNEVFYHEEKYPYLKKVFDSQESGYSYHVKIYEINYDVFDKQNKSTE